MSISETKKAEYIQRRQAHWNRIHASGREADGWYYHKYLRHIYSRQVPAGHRVLELGCGGGALLAALKPSFGLGIDFSPYAVQLAGTRHPHLSFEVADAEGFSYQGEPFDYIILSDLVNDLWDVQAMLTHLRRHCHPRTRIILNIYSKLWQLPLQWARRLGLARPLLAQNWLTSEDVQNLMQLAGLEVLRSWPEVLVPAAWPGAGISNRYLSRLIPFRWLCLTNFYVCRPPSTKSGTPSCSIIVAARNEAGNIRELIRRIPIICPDQEVVFVEGGSTDDTYLAIEEAIKDGTPYPCRLIRQPGKGKGDAVRAGFDMAKGDILMILDADMTVAPEDLRLFYDAMAEGHGEFINGVRLVYPMEEQAMRFFNLVGNKFFAYAFSWLLGQPVRDTLCGTKVLWRSDYRKIAENRAYFGDFDPFGDFDLLFGAAKLNLKILEIPVRYAARTYGNTNISRWSAGWLLLRMTAFAARKIKFGS
jgi:SAM-dependent methyltransferase